MFVDSASLAAYASTSAARAAPSAASYAARFLPQKSISHDSVACSWLTRAACCRRAAAASRPFSEKRSRVLEALPSMRGDSAVALASAAASALRVRAAAMFNVGLPRSASSISASSCAIVERLPPVARGPRRIRYVRVLQRRVAQRARSRRAATSMRREPSACSRIRRSGRRQRRTCDGKRYPCRHIRQTFSRARVSGSAGDVAQAIDA